MDILLAEIDEVLLAEAGLAAMPYASGFGSVTAMPALWQVTIG
jgi:hypothetical protein